MSTNRMINVCHIDVFVSQYQISIPVLVLFAMANYLPDELGNEKVILANGFRRYCPELW